jgi:hypothetical protein
VGWENCDVEIVGPIHFIGNRAGHGGGALFWRKGGRLKAQRLVMETNEADFGGAVDIDGGTATFEHCEFTENRAKEGGAVFSNSDRRSTTLDFKNCTIQKNKATRRGGAVLMVLNPKGTETVNATLRLEGGAITENRGPSGGGVSLVQEKEGSHLLKAELKGVSITSNHAKKGSGGAVMAKGPVQFEGSDLKILKNTAKDKGGGLFFDGAQATLKGSVVKENEATNGGGIFWKGDEPQLDESTAVQGNKPDDVLKGE